MGRLTEPRDLVALALLALGALGTLRVLALLPAAAPAALAGELAISLLALVAGVSLWRRSAWAPPALAALGVAFAVTRLVDAFVLGIRPWLFALASAAAALVVALLLAAWARPEPRRTAPRL